MPIPRDKDLILPLYLDRAKAEAELAAFRKTNPSVKVKLLPIPLNVANEKILELNKQLKTKKLFGAVIPRPQDRAQAVKLLKAQGLNDKAINDGLSVPVFFTKPFLTINTPRGHVVFSFSPTTPLKAPWRRCPIARNSIPRRPICPPSFARSSNRRTTSTSSSQPPITSSWCRSRAGLGRLPSLPRSSSRS